MDLAVIVSPLGKLYMVENYKCVCSYVEKWESIYCFSSYVDDELSDFLDAEIDADTHEIALYRHRDATRECMPEIWGSDEELKKYVLGSFGCGSTVNSIQQTMDIDKSGEPVIGETPCFRITRKDFTLRTNSWQLKFSKFEANYIDDEDCFFSLKVFPTFDTDAFKNVCVMIGVEDDEQIASDMWFDRMIAADIDIGSALSGDHKVFKASCGGEQVVVKRIEGATSTFKPACLKVWRTINQHIRGLKGLQIQDGLRYLIFEYFDCTLEEYLLGWPNPDKMPILWVNVFRDIVKGLIYLHELEICHMNLNPYNIIMADDAPKFSGFTKAEELTRHRKDEDLRALGKLIMFSFSPRDGPLKEKVYDDKRFSESAMYSWAVEARDIASRLQRPSVTLVEVLEHLWLFGSDKRIQYLCEAAQYLASQHCDNHMIEHQSDYFTQQDWTAVVPKSLMNHMRTWKHKDAPEDVDPEPNVYNGQNPRHLLKFARNIFCHLVDISMVVGRMECLSDAENFEYQLRLWFPKLMMGTYNYVKRRIQKTHEKDRMQFANLTRYYST